jgi:osmotically-inducible protein OsmY
MLKPRHGLTAQEMPNPLTGIAFAEQCREAEMQGARPISCEGGGQMTRTREQIKKDIVEQLYLDGRVDAADVNVDVEDGNVRLHGTVPTLIARHFASAGALATTGVRTVDNQLKVRYPSTATVPSDEQIRSNVEMVLGWNADIDAQNVRVSVNKGMVTLEGSVDAMWKQGQIENIVSQLTGVTGIENRMATVPTKDISDEVIAQSVKAALKLNPLINESTVAVQVANAVVTLTGVVPSAVARRLAYDAALYTTGAIGVNDQLMVAE